MSYPTKNQQPMTNGQTPPRARRVHRHNPRRHVGHTVAGRPRGKPVHANRDLGQGPTANPFLEGAFHQRQAPPQNALSLLECILEQVPPRPPRGQHTNHVRTEGRVGRLKARVFSFKWSLDLQAPQRDHILRGDGGRSVLNNKHTNTVDI